MCNSAVQRLLDWDKEGVLHYAKLQGEYATEVLPAEVVKDLSTMVVRIDGENFKRSTAVIKICKIVRKFPLLIVVFSMIPRPLRDLGYAFVAKIRHRVPSKDSCRILTAEQNALFLD